MEETPVPMIVAYTMEFHFTAGFINYLHKRSWIGACPVFLKRRNTFSYPQSHHLPASNGNSETAKCKCIDRYAKHFKDNSSNTK